MCVPVASYANVCIILMCLAIALPAAASTVGVDGASSSWSRLSRAHASHEHIPDFSIAISSTKFPGDMEWTYDRNVQAALAATSAAGPLPIPIFTTEIFFYF
jgi:hypothetical protein